MVFLHNLGKNNKEFRKWLENNHLSAEECWIECKCGQMKDQSIFIILMLFIPHYVLDGLIRHLEKKTELDCKGLVQGKKTVIGPK